MPNPEWFAASKAPSQIPQPQPGEAQMLIDDELWQSCRFFDRALAVRWGEGIRDRLIRGEQIDWP